VAQERPFNPLDYANLGQSVAEALLARPALPLGALTPFVGAGVYAIYYSGAFPAYAALAAVNRRDPIGVPIYVGKATPAGGRKGGRGTGAAATQALFRRLSDHVGSITEAKNLDLADFACRYLVVEDIWIPLGESLIIERFAPLWNVVVEGFGNHDPGAGRLSGQRPMWDMIHPGRYGAAKFQPNRRAVPDILAMIEQALAGWPVETLPADVQAAEADSDTTG